MQISLNTLEALRALPAPAIIGVSGFGGSGKSGLATLLSSELDAPVVSVDEFMTDTSRTDFHIWDIMDFARLEREVLAPFMAGTVPLRYRTFDWAHNKIGEFTTLHPSSLLIVEGVGLFRPELVKYFSYRIWVDCPIDEAIARGKRRDREDQGVVNDPLWDGVWKSNDLEYFETFQPKSGADMIIDNSETQAASSA